MGSFRSGTLVPFLLIIKVFYNLPISLGVFYFRTCAFSNITTDIDDINTVCHVNLSFVHIVQHLFGAHGPDFLVATVAEEADADDDVTGEGKTLLRFQECILETRTAAKGYDGVFADHFSNYF